MLIIAYIIYLSFYYPWNITKSEVHVGLVRNNLKAIATPTRGVYGKGRGDPSLNRPTENTRPLGYNNVMFV